MVSGKPPRRSKAPDEPVTIDLTAEETAAPKDGVNAEPDRKPMSMPPTRLQ